MKNVIKVPVETEDTQVSESSALEAMLQMYREQQETNRLALNILKELGDKVTTMMHKEVMARRRNDAKRIEIEREDLELKKQQLHVQNTCQRQSAKNLTELPKAALAAKSSATAKSKAKSGSRTRKKAT